MCAVESRACVFPPTPFESTVLFRAVGFQNVDPGPPYTADAGAPLLRLERSTGTDGEPDVTIRLNRGAIRSAGAVRRCGSTSDRPRVESTLISFNWLKVHPFSSHWLSNVNPRPYSAAAIGDLLGRLQFYKATVRRCGLKSRCIFPATWRIWYLFGRSIIFGKWGVWSLRDIF